jgi:NADPH:quinone reductase-like Zn-dependent oxidoreductase
LDTSQSDQAGLQEYAILNANAIAKTPRGFSDEQVSTLPVNLVTSWIALFTRTGFGIPPPFVKELSSFQPADTSIVIIGGGTNAGKLAVQLAHLAGIGKIIAIAGTSNKDKLTSMGATHVIDRHSTLAYVAKQIQAITGTDGAQYVYNCANGQSDPAIAALSSSKTSRLRSLLPIQGEEAEKLKSQRPLCDVAYFHCTNESLAPYTKEFWAHVPKWLEERKILPTEYRVIEGLDKVQEIDETLDMYRDGARAVPQTVVKI